MTYAQLKKREEELKAQLNEVHEDLVRIGREEVLGDLARAILALQDVDQKSPSEVIFHSAYCEHCDEEFDIDIELCDVIEALNNLRERIERCLNRNV